MWLALRVTLMIIKYRNIKYQINSKNLRTLFVKYGKYFNIKSLAFRFTIWNFKIGQFNFLPFILWVRFMLACQYCNPWPIYREKGCKEAQEAAKAVWCHRQSWSCGSQRHRSCSYHQWWLQQRSRHGHWNCHWGFSYNCTGELKQWSSETFSL